MKTSKITKVTPNGSFTGQYGTLYKFEVHFENGEYGDANCKSADQKQWVVGETVSYELTPNTNPQFNGKLKKIEEQKQGGQTKDPAVQKMIIAQSSLSSAVEFMKNQQPVNSEDVMRVADKFYNWVLQKGGL